MVRKSTDVPSKRQVVKYWKNRLPLMGIWIDWNEPGCWTCGFHYDGKYDVKRPTADWQKIYRAWDRIPLQRCHIVPHSNGGANTPDNIFLMCRECHDLMPDFTITDVFFDWARRQSWWTREFAKVRAALDAFDFDPGNVERLSAVIHSREFKSWMSGRMGLHRPQSNYAPRSSRLKPATIIGPAIYYLRNCTTA